MSGGRFWLYCGCLWRCSNESVCSFVFVFSFAVGCSGGEYAMSKRKGTRAEKKVVDWFKERGWHAQRTGGSGGGISDIRSDVIAMRPEKYGLSCVVNVEVKSRDSGSVRLSKDEIKQLSDVRDRCGGLELVVVRPDLRLSMHDHMYAFRLDEMKENKKSFTVTKGMLPGPSLEEQVERFFGEV